MTGSDDLNTVDLNAVDGGITNLVPLNDAVKRGDLEAVTALLAAGAFPDGRDETGFTPLMHAARDGHTHIAQALLAAGADVNRLGYLQRFYPLDFAEWTTRDASTIELIEEAGGRRVSEQIDVSHVAGGPMIAHVSRNLAAVYPEPFTRAVGDEQLAIRLGTVRSDRHLVLLFTAGLSAPSDVKDATHACEISLALPAPWALLQTYRDIKTVFSFPLDFLTRVAQRLRAGQAIQEGLVISRDDPDVADLTWPEPVHHLVAVDHQWAVDTPEPLGPRDVTLYTFAPVRSTRTVLPEASAAKAVATLRTSRPKRLSLPYYWKERW
mgnify:FL=1